MTTFRKKLTVSAIAVTMLTASLGGLPLSQKGLSEKLGFVNVVNAAGAQLPSNGFLERMNGLHAALAAGDPVDVQEVRSLRDEIAGLDVTTSMQLIDPIWNQISDNLPASVNQAELKISLFQIVKAVGAFQFDPQASELEKLRTNPEFRATLKTIAAAGGEENIIMDDFLVFLFGDGGSRGGIEGTIANILKAKSPIEMAMLLGSKQGIIAVLLQATEKLLGESGDYKFSTILANLGVTPQDVQRTVLGFQLKLQKDEPAINAMTIAYIRSEAVGTAKVSEDGLRHDYSLEVFGVNVPSLVLQWTKVSGSPEVSVQPNGVVSIPEDVLSGSAVIQAKLINPYGGSAKVIYEQEITLTAPDEVGDIFPAEQFLERMDKLRAALFVGDPADVQAVRKLRDEIAGLNVAANRSLIDPIWNRISPHLPDAADQERLRNNLFDILKAVGSFQYDPNASDLEDIRTNPEFRMTLKTIAAAGGVTSLTIDDFLIFLFGDGEEREGIEGKIVDIVVSMKPKEIAGLLGDKKKFNALINEAMADVLSNKEDYVLSAALHNLDVKPIDVRTTVSNFQVKLKYDEQATHALTVAYIRSEAKPTVKVTANGRHHQYGLTVLDVEIPSSVLKWKKVSGSKDVKVDSNGKVSIPNKTARGTAVIQATLVNPYGGPAKVVFQQEVTLVDGKDNPDTQVEPIIKALEAHIGEITARYDAAVNEMEKVLLLMEVIQSGKDTVEQINKVDAPKAIKNKAINAAKNQVQQTVNLFIRDLMNF